MADQRRWRRWLLVGEFASLAILIGSMMLLGRQQQAVSHLWLLVPAAASLTLFLSFLGLMYQRWLINSDAGARQPIHRAIFIVLALSLLGIWAYAIHRTWQSIDDASQKATAPVSDQAPVNTDELRLVADVSTQGKVV